MRRSQSIFVGSLLALAMVASCRDSNPAQQDASVNPYQDAGTGQDGNTPTDGGGQYVFNSVKELRAAPPAVFTQVTLTSAVVTGLAGNYKTLYVQDADGGPKSGIAIYCNFAASSNPCPIPQTTMKTFKPGQKVKVIGTFDVFNGKEEIKPSTIEVLDANEGPLPPFAEIPAAQAVETLTQSDYEGCLVKIANVSAASPLTVTSTTPAAFKNTSATGTDCSKGPSYSAFEVSDGTNTIAVMTSFYRGIDIQTDPACIIMYDGGVPSDRLVVPGDKFTKLSGILDVDPFDMNGLTLSPVTKDQYEYVPAGDHDGGL